MVQSCVSVSEAPAREHALAHFAHYLGAERGLAATTVENYLNQVSPFVCWHRRNGQGELAAVTAAEIHRFVTWRATSCSPGSIKVAGTALRAWLRWMFLTGQARTDLSAAVGPVRYPARSRLPKGFASDELAALLTVECSARDRAVLVVLTRLALRAAEAAGLELEDINWRAATIRVAGKGANHQLMPLPGEVGEALADYLTQRPTGTGHRQVFLAAAPPHEPLTRHGISSIIIRLARRAGLTGPGGAHRLRHAAASNVLAAGGTLTEAGQLLRHRSYDATMTYAAVDYQSLAYLARPWPVTSTPTAVSA